MRISAPTYTQVPNDLVDHWLPHLTGVEVKILMVIMRKTFGWGKKRDRISLSQMQNITGAHKTSIVKAAESLQSKGLIRREIEGTLGNEKTYYELIVYESDSNPKPTNSNNSDQSNFETSQDNSNNSYQSNFETGDQSNFETHKRNVKKKRSYKDIYNNDNGEVDDPVGAGQTSQSSFSISNCSGIVFFDLATYRLADGKPLSLRMQRSLAKYEGKPLQNLTANVLYYEKQAANPKVKIDNHEAYLQNCISKNYAGSQSNLLNNELYAKLIVEENKDFDIQILKSVVQVGKRGRSGYISIKKEIDPEKFGSQLDNAIAGWTE